MDRHQLAIAQDMLTPLVVDRVLVGEDGTKSVTEASTIGIRPGRPWPSFIDIKFTDCAVRYSKRESFSHGGEFAGMVYESGDGRRLIVFND